jgi:hypothetical protein
VSFGLYDLQETISDSYRFARVTLNDRGGFPASGITSFHPSHSKIEQWLLGKSGHFWQSRYGGASAVDFHHLPFGFYQLETAIPVQLKYALT